MSEENNKEEEIDILESVVVKYKDVSIAISGEPEGVLEGKTSEQVILYCSDILQKSVGEGGLQESIEIPQALRETLQVNYGWSDIEFNQFISLWRKNLYLMKIGQDNGENVDLAEYNRFMLYLEKKKKQELGEMDAGDTSESALEEFAEEASTTPKVLIEGQEIEIIPTQEDKSSKKVEKKSKSK